MQAKIEGKTDKEMPECWNLQFLEKFSANNFVLSDAENNSGASNRGGIADLRLLRTQKSCEVNFWKVIGSYYKQYFSYYKQVLQLEGLLYNNN